MSDKKPTKKKKKKKKRRKASDTGDEPAELDAREAARALKKALAEAGPDEESAQQSARPRRRRPPTSHGAPMARPVRRRRPTPEPEPPDPKLRPPSAFIRYDLAVILLAAVMLTAGTFTYRSLTAVTLQRLETRGLSLGRPTALLPPIELDPPGSETAGDGTPLPYHVEYQSPTSPLMRLEILVERRPEFNNLQASRALDRVSRYGEIYWAEPSETVKIAGRNWLRTRFRYGHKANAFDSPEVATGVEFATLNGGLVYVVTAHGTPDEADELADLIAPTLNADANHPAATIRKEAP